MRSRENPSRKCFHTHTLTRMCVSRISCSFSVPRPWVSESYFCVWGCAPTILHCTWVSVSLWRCQSNKCVNWLRVCVLVCLSVKPLLDHQRLCVCCVRRGFMLLKTSRVLCGSVFESLSLYKCVCMCVCVCVSVCVWGGVCVCVTVGVC